MAQLRHDYDEFKALNAEVLVIVPNGPKMIERHVESNGTPNPILSDKGARVAEAYGIGTRRAALIGFTALKPGVFLVDTTGHVIYTNYVASYIKEPDNREPLGVLEGMAV